jgi:hypothetical protein
MSGDLEAEIRAIRSKYMLFRYLLVKIDCADLPKTTTDYDPSTKLRILEFTPAALDTVRQFIAYAVSIYNDQHPDMPSSFYEAEEAIRSALKQDEIDAIKERSIPA